MCTSLLRSKLTYAQEVFFNAPKHLLKKLQSIDSKGYKIALGLPIHTSSLKMYNEICVLPLDVQRELACAKYIARMKTINHISKDELNLNSELHFPKRSKKYYHIKLLNHMHQIFQIIQELICWTKILLKDLYIFLFQNGN